MNFVTSFLSEWSGIPLEIWESLLWSVITVTVSILIRSLILRLLGKGLEKPKLRFLVRRITSYTITTLMILVLTGIWFRGLGDFFTFIGLSLAAIVIAFKEPFTNFLAWLYILSSRPFTFGDRIQIGEVHGDVIDLQAFCIVLLEVRNWVDADQGTGRIIHVPSSRVFTESVANYNLGFPYIWNEIPVLITFESDWEKAKSILTRLVNEQEGATLAEAEKAVQEASQNFPIKYNEITPSVYTSVKKSGVLLTLRYLCSPKQRRISEMELWEKILTTFRQESDIVLA